MDSRLTTHDYNPQKDGPDRHDTIKSLDNSIKHHIERINVILYLIIWPS